MSGSGRGLGFCSFIILPGDTAGSETTLQVASVHVISELSPEGWAVFAAATWILVERMMPSVNRHDRLEIAGELQNLQFVL